MAVGTVAPVQCKILVLTSSESATQKWDLLIHCRDRGVKQRNLSLQAKFLNIQVQLKLLLKVCNEVVLCE